VVVAEQTETRPRSSLGREIVPEAPFVEVKGPRLRQSQRKCVLRRESGRLSEEEYLLGVSEFPIQEETGSILANL
jgi:hypothetical protein